MKIATTKLHLDRGNISRRPRDMRRLLNLNYLSLTNKTYCDGEYSLPVIYCDTNIIPDYLALYTQPGDYHKTALTGVCFYVYDNTFDGINGLFNAIYYKNDNLINYYKRRFRGVRFFISPDYSQFGDLQKIENLFRLWKARVVTLWFLLELHAVVIPNFTYISEDTFPLFCTGLEQCSVVAFSTKGHLKSARERYLLKSAIKYAVDHLHLKTIVVYSVCGKDETALKLFSYATEKGIRVAIPANSLRERNMRRYMNQ